MRVLAPTMSIVRPEIAHRPVFVIGSLVLACCARVARCPEPGETVRATGFILEPGGKGFNVALAVHRLGMAVDGLFAVGDDAPGALMRATFARLGLPEALIRTVDAPTGSGVGLIQDDGENRIAVYPGANERLGEGEVRDCAQRLRAASLVFAQFEASDAPIRAAFTLAGEAGITTLLNPSPYRTIDPAILAATDILVVNRTEAAALAADLGLSERLDDLAAALAPTLLVVTRGAEGASAWEAERPFHQPGFAVEVADSIGAGDAFTGGFIAAIAQGRALSEALEWGCAAGALAVARLGLIDALPDSGGLRAMIAAGR